MVKFIRYNEMHDEFDTWSSNHVELSGHNCAGEILVDVYYGPGSIQRDRFILKPKSRFEINGKKYTRPYVIAHEQEMKILLKQVHEASALDILD